MIFQHWKMAILYWALKFKKEDTWLIYSSAILDKTMDIHVFEHNIMEHSKYKLGGWWKLTGNTPT